MPTPDFLGARGSNAGDDFHELWVLRHALQLLDPDTDLKAVTAEGLLALDEKGFPKDTWDGVDCVFYYEAGSIERLVVDQIKYSSADPGNTWTISRLTKTTNENKDNSVIGRLGKAFAGLRKNRSEIVAKKGLEIRLVSNQGISSSVISALQVDGIPKNKRDADNRQKLVAASGLDTDSFREFAEVLDLSQCGTDSRFAVEEKIRLTVSQWTDDDARGYVNGLLGYVRRQMMMPETKGEIITKESLLFHFGFGDYGGLFPCPSRVDKIGELVPREATKRLFDALMASETGKIIFHGEGGCGKTTALQELETLLPRDSTVVFFDCYGGGTYLDSEAYRHLPIDAFLQLSNDVARLLRSPLFVKRGDDSNPARSFHKRLIKAAEIVAATNTDALLVVIVDAADNSITAAKSRNPHDRSFIHDLVRLGSLPQNVRLLLSARSGRLADLDLPADFTTVHIGTFTRKETATHAHARFPGATGQWIDDFHFYSSGVPRVQRYAFGDDGASSDDALQRLLPNGKLLPEVFREQLKRASNLAGNKDHIRDLCAAVSLLPRPIPIRHLAAVVGLPELHVNDMCGDLRPGLRVDGEMVGFGDEDFEEFLRESTESVLADTKSKVAEHFLSTHETDAYAATHVTGALYDAGQYGEILDLVNSDHASAIGDPVLRRETQLQRFKIAMKVCRLTNNRAESIMTLIRGAEALKTDTTILNTLLTNPDHAAQFSRDRSNRVILRDPELIGEHGRLLFQRILVDSREDKNIAVREGFRQLDAWLERRRQVIEKRKNEDRGHFDGWKIETDDIAAETEAVLRLHGPERALNSLRRWKPRRIAIGVAGLLAKNLLDRGEGDLLVALAESARGNGPWSLFLQVPLAVGGLPVDLAELETSVKKLGRSRFIAVASVERSYERENPLGEFHEVFLTACEVLAASGVRSETLIKALTLLSDPEIRRRDRLSSFAEPRIDICLRAHVLLERFEGRTPSIQSFLTDPPEIQKSEAEGKPKPVEKSDLDLLVEPFLPLYDLRARLLAGDLDNVADIETLRDAAISTSWNLEYRTRRESSNANFRFLAALSMAKMTMLPRLDAAFIYSTAKRLNGGSSGPYSSRNLEILGQFTKFPSLHNDILDSISKTVSTIKHERMPANEKIAGLVETSRLLIPISSSDAEAVFSDAIAIAADVDEDAIYELELFDPLASRAGLADEERRTIAISLAKIVSDISVRLKWIDRFPWDRSMRALTLLDPAIALAASSRWEDDNLVGVDTTLEPLLSTAVENGALTECQAVAFLAFMQEAGSELITTILQSVKNSGLAGIELVAEEIANDELNHFKFGKRKQIAELLTSSLKDLAIPEGKCVSQLRDVTGFVSRVHEERSKSEEEDESSGTSLSGGVNTKVLSRRNQSQEEREALVRNAIEWNDYTFIQSSEIERAIGELRRVAGSNHVYIPVGEILAAIAARVPIADRVDHLDALLGVQLSTSEEEQIPVHVNRQLEDWNGSPAVVQWGIANRETVLIRFLPTLTQYLKYGDAKAIKEVLGQLGTNDESIAKVLINAVERHVDYFDAATIYSLVGVIIPYCEKADAETVLTWYSGRLFDRIPLDDREEWIPDDVPADLWESIARFVYSQLSDIDVRKRWRAAHVLRRLARVGEQSILDKTIELFERTSENSFRKPGASFYWLAARMWLLIALDRIASESPNALKDQFEKLVRIAKDESFPHLLVREYAKSAAMKLMASGFVAVGDDVRKQLESTNRSNLRKSVRKDRYGDGFEKYRTPGFETRFHFDQMDTLPYWYSRAIRTFAKLDKKTFLETADKWIVDEWDIKSEPWIWLQDGRNDRLEGARQSLSSAGHGTLPVVERFSTHLEWHAMWCVVGQLMQEYPLAKADADGYDPFDELTKTEGISQPPRWLADNLSSKPLAERYWFEPIGKVDHWLESINDEDFLRELVPDPDKKHLTAAGDITTRSSKFRESITIESALVEPQTAAALLRALQSVESAYDYKLPLVGEEFEIRESPYGLTGWLQHGDRPHGLDEKDPFRREILPIQIEPCESILQEFDLRFVDSSSPLWLDGDGLVAFGYDVWSDSRWDDNRDRPHYSGVFSDAWRLSITPEMLAKILSEKNMDLIVEVRIQRRNRDYEYSGHSREEAKEKDFDRIFLLRRDGTIESTEGRVGTWKTSCS